jgi:hypothetical protein
VVHFSSGLDRPKAVAEEWVASSPLASVGFGDAD